MTDPSTADDVWDRVGPSTMDYYNAAEHDAVVLTVLMKEIRVDHGDEPFDDELGIPYFEPAEYITPGLIDRLTDDWELPVTYEGMRDGYEGIRVSISTKRRGFILTTIPAGRDGYREVLATMPFPDFLEEKIDAARDERTGGGSA